MDLNRGAAALYESNAGGRRPGFRVLRWIPLFGAPKWHPSKNREMDGAPVLGGRYSMGRRNNQPNDSFGGRGGAREEMGLGGTRGGGSLLVVLGGKIE